MRFSFKPYVGCCHSVLPATCEASMHVPVVLGFLPRSRCLRTICHVSNTPQVSVGLVSKIHGFYTVYGDLKHMPLNQTGMWTTGDECRIAIALCSVSRWTELAGDVVTLNRLYKFVKDTWPSNLPNADVETFTLVRTMWMIVCMESRVSNNWAKATRVYKSQECCQRSYKRWRR